MSTEYHVGCGLFGIYCGRLNKDKTEWVEKTECTDAAIHAVVNYFRDELLDNEKTHRHSEYRFIDGSRIVLDVRLEKGDKQE